MQQSKPVLWEFAPFIVDPLRATITRDGEVRPLRRQSFAVLQHLIERRDSVQSISTLIAAVWQTPPANSEASVMQCIKDIRKALGPDHDWIIKTVTGIGYQFVPEITLSPVAAPPPDVHRAIAANTAAQAPATAVAAEMPSVAEATLPWPTHKPVLPALLVIATILALLAAGALRHPSGRSAASIAPIVEAPLTMLAAPTLTVVARSQPVQGFADHLTAELRRTPKGYTLTLKPPAPDSIARDLGTIARLTDARYVLTAGMNEASLVLQMHEHPGNRQIWAMPVEVPKPAAEQQTLFARIAREIAVRIRTLENQRPLPAKVEAGHLIIQGRALLESERDQEVNASAMALFDKAVGMDDTHIQGLLGYGRTRLIAVANRWEPEGQTQAYLQQATWAADRALALDKATAGAHLIRGVIARLTGDPDGAVAAFRHALTINELYPLAYGELGRALIDKQDFDGAIKAINRAVTMSPGDPVTSFWFYWAGMAAGLAGDTKASLDWMVRSRQANPRYRATLPWIAIGYQQLGDQVQAERAIQELRAAAPKFTAAAWVKANVRSNAALRERYSQLSLHLIAIGVPRN